MTSKPLPAIAVIGEHRRAGHSVADSVSGDLKGKRARGALVCTKNNGRWAGRTSGERATSNTQYYVGDLVEIRSKEEILSTLDSRGQLEGLPFMPQMFQYCGQRFRIYKRAHKTCDTITGEHKSRRMDRAVHLEGIRCDGQAYGGCDANCLIFWKEAWLKRVDDPVAIGRAEKPVGGASRGWREEDVWPGTKTQKTQDAADPIYVCQITQLIAATEQLSSWDVRQYLEDLASGNIGLARMISGFVYQRYSSLINAAIGLGRPLRWLYDSFQRLSGGIPYPRRKGQIAAGSKTPSASLGLQPGEWVRVKSYKEILATLDVKNKNRGLYFDAEMVPFRGRTFGVVERVTKILDEATGRITEFKGSCIMLEGVVCEGRYSECRLFCSRSIPRIGVRFGWRAFPPMTAPGKSIKHRLLARCAVRSGAM